MDNIEPKKETRLKNFLVLVLLLAPLTSCELLQLGEKEKPSTQSVAPIPTPDPNPVATDVATFSKWNGSTWDSTGLPTSVPKLTTWVIKVGTKYYACSTTKIFVYDDSDWLDTTMAASLDQNIVGFTYDGFRHIVATTSGLLGWSGTGWVSSGLPTSIPTGTTGIAFATNSYTLTTGNKVYYLMEKTYWNDPSMVEQSLVTNSITSIKGVIYDRANSRDVILSDQSLYTWNGGQSTWTTTGLPSSLPAGTKGMLYDNGSITTYSF